MESLSPNSLWNAGKKSLGFFGVVWYVGSLSREHQKPFLEKMGWRENVPTLLNASILGFGMSAFYHIGGESSAGLIENHVNSLLSTIFGGGFNFYAIYNFLQSTGRIIYSQKTGKAVPSYTLHGLVMNGVASSVSNYKRFRSR
jgi:hypothetical protein